MGNFYVNYTLRGPSQVDVAKALSGRRARVTPVHEDCIVVYDEKSDKQDRKEITRLAKKLSKKLACPVLAVLNHDDDILWYRLYEKGKLTDEYDSTPGYWVDTTELSPPSGGDAEKLCAVFGGSPALVSDILRLSSFDSERYVFAVDRHLDLVKALGVSDYAVGTAYVSFDVDEAPPGLQRDDVLQIDIAVKQSSRRRKTKDFNESNAIALFVAASEDDVASIRRLIAEGVNPDVQSQAGHTPLHNACRGGKADAAKTLLELGANPHFRYDYHSISGGLESNRTVLMYAGSCEIVRVLLDRGADPNAEDAIGFTPLMQAAMRRDLEAIELLLAAGANPLARVRPGKGKTGKNAREFAAGWNEFYRAVPPGPDVTEALDKIAQVVARLAEAEKQVESK
jgi:Ankyrin repeats (3 copies)/Ankyrin repeat